MILDKPNRYWIYVLPSTRGVFFPHYKGKRITKEEYLQHWGKWIVLDDKEKLDMLALKLDLIVELRWVYMIKYSRSVPEIGNFDKPIMYIFCDDRERGEILRLLSLIGVMPHGWEYEREMFEHWKPGGEFLEQWIAAQGLSAEEAERVRLESQQQDERWIEYMFGTGEEAEKLREETPSIWTPEDMWMLPAKDEDDRE